MGDLVVTDHPEAERYEMRDGDELLGVLEYRGGGKRLALTHTEIYGDREGQGLGSKLIAAVLDDLRDRGLQVIPICPFVKRFLQQHDEYLDLVAADLRGAFGLA